MNKRVICLGFITTCFSSMLAQFHCHAHDTETTNGVLWRAKVEPVDFDQYCEYGSDHWMGDLDGKRLKVPLLDIREYEVLGVTAKERLSEFTVRVVSRKTGKEFVLEKALYYSHGAKIDDFFALSFASVKVRNPITGELDRNSLNLEPGVRVSFGMKVGRLKICPENHQENTLACFFPPDYTFCPFHGTKLEWHENAR